MERVTMPDAVKSFDEATVPAFFVRQWLPEWDLITWNDERFQRQPDEGFFVFAMSAPRLRQLSEVHKHNATIENRAEPDLNTQRYHIKSRSLEIAEYVRGGFPYAELSTQKRASDDSESLRKPGWLPTSILVNILKPGDERDGRVLLSEDAITVEKTTDAMCKLRIPHQSGQLSPIEVIDGQHRLRAFDNLDADDLRDYEVPVVAFHGLDRSWQAYLFWTINIRPKRISASLAYDLYPLLRGEDWLEKVHGHPVYRETRAQELVQALWYHPQSPWRNRINLLKEPGHVAEVSQAAWIGSLLATFLRTWQGSGKSGGLFGAPRSSNDRVLPWTIAQ